MQTATFEGWVDFVVPADGVISPTAGFTDITSAQASGTTGARTKTRNFVIRYSQFDGVPGFPLGRHHRDAQLYLLDCIFSGTWPTGRSNAPLTSPNLVPWNWGVRHYFYNCHREGGDFAWFKDNLSTAEGSPNSCTSDCGWTFGGKWNPEEEMPPFSPLSPSRFLAMRHTT